MQSSLEESSGCDSVSRGFLDPKDVSTYNGIRRTNTFICSEEVHIFGLTFFGPTREVGPLTVFLTVRTSQKIESPYDKDLEVYREGRVTVKPKKDSTFFVEFLTPIRIPKDVWIDISFVIESLEPRLINFGQLQNKDLNIMSRLSKSGAMTFRFLRGSRQMQMIHFIMP